MKYLILFLLSSASFACEQSMSIDDLQAIKSGSPPAVVKVNCVGARCVCVDGFPYPIDSEGLKLATLDTVAKAIAVDPVKEQAMKDAQAADQAARDAKTTNWLAIKERFKSGTATAQDKADALKFLVEKL